MKKLALALSLMLVLSACGAPSSEATSKPDDKPSTVTQEVKDDTPKKDDKDTSKDDEGTSKNEEDAPKKDSFVEEYLNSINSETAEAKGVCGEDMVWYYKENVLVIKGTGEMINYYNERSYESSSPFFNLDISWVIVDEGITSIGSGAFGTFVHGSENISKVVLPSTLEAIGAYAFSACDQLHEIEIPESVWYIGEDAFSRCDGLKSINIPLNVTHISKNAFGWCDSLSEINIPQNVTYIGEGAFYCCYQLSNITIPAKVTYIGGSAFSSLPDNATITFLGDLPELDGYVFDDNITIKYSSPTFDAIKDDYPNITWIKQ